MCITPGSRLFLRTDEHHLITGTLPAVKSSPAAHMNYDGSMDYDNSGYLSLFEYIPAQVCFPDGKNASQSAWSAINRLYSSFIHLIFMPATITQINLTEDNVRHLPTSGRTPCLFNTDACSPPSKISEDGRVIEYAQRYINEYLYSGNWLQGTKIITVKRDNTLFNLLKSKAPISLISETCDSVWPCRANDDPEGGSGCGGGSATTV
jgi:hypothetical protein